MFAQLPCRSLARQVSAFASRSGMATGSNTNARHLLRFQSSTAASPTLASPTLSPKYRTYLGVAGGLFLAGLHSATGSQDDFFDYRFKAVKNPDDLATFYGGEEFMELFCIFPFVGNLMMRNGSFDDEGNVHTQGFPGTLKVSMVFSSDENEETGETEWFNKRERFRNIFMGWTAWDMVINFGFRTRDDGTVEVYHHGEYFHGNMPIVSQIMKLAFQVHARWLAWSTEHHVNHYAFPDTEEGEQLEEESRQNMPMFLLKHYAWTDLMAMLSGRESKTPSFLIKTSNKTTDQDDDDEYLPVHDELTKLRIGHDIAVDRMTTHGMLARQKTETDGGMNTGSLDRKETSHHAYGVATEAARLRQMTRQNTMRKTQEQEEDEDRESNDAAVYGSATAMARLRQLNRANTLLRMEKEHDTTPTTMKKTFTKRHLTRVNTFRRSFKDTDAAPNMDGKTQEAS
eukprot:scaffold906_cov151-Amphora_coffeaeformis.AAC.5